MLEMSMTKKVPRTLSVGVPSLTMLVQLGNGLLRYHRAPGKDWSGVRELLLSVVFLFGRHGASFLLFTLEGNAERKEVRKVERLRARAALPFSSRWSNALVGRFCSREATAGSSSSFTGSF